MLFYIFHFLNVAVKTITSCIFEHLLCATPRVWALSDDTRLTYVCLSRASVVGLSREQCD